MQKHPDADAFIRSYLEQPADAVARLVFADWLQETGEEHNVAWAQFIRLRIEAARFAPGSIDRNLLDREADTHAPHIRARLAISANLFVRYPKSLLELLPAPNITVRLANFIVPQTILELMPESVARENLVLPLDLQSQTLLVATTDLPNYDTIQKLHFILNKDIVAVRAEQEDVLNAINRHYGQTEWEVVDSVLVEFADVAGGITHLVLNAEQEPTQSLIERMIRHALRMGANRIDLRPSHASVTLQYLVDGTWFDDQTLPSSFWPGVTEVIADMANLPLTDTFDDRRAANGGATRSFPFQVANTNFTVVATIRLGQIEPGVTLDIQHDTHID